VTEARFIACLASIIGEGEPMTEERFNELLRGPLAHPFAPLAYTRLVLALYTVLLATGEQGDRALEAYCSERQRRDEQQ
jgi:hypothetical protein